MVHYGNGVDFPPWQHDHEHEGLFLRHCVYDWIQSNSGEWMEEQLLLCANVRGMKMKNMDKGRSRVCVPSFVPHVDNSYPMLDP